MADFDLRFCDGREGTFDDSFADVADGAGPAPRSLGAIYDAMAAQGLLSVYCYRGVPTRREFVNSHDYCGRWTYGWFTPDGEPACLATVGDMSGKIGMFDFCFLAAGHADRFAIARQCMGMVCGPEEAGGLDAVMGLTPLPYRHAWKFAQDVGFEKLAILPRACFMARKGRDVDGMLTIYRKRGA